MIQRKVKFFLLKVCYWNNNYCLQQYWSWTRSFYYRWNLFKLLNTSSNFHPTSHTNNSSTSLTPFRCFHVATDAGRAFCRWWRTQREPQRRHVIDRACVFKSASAIDCSTLWREYFLSYNQCSLFLHVRDVTVASSVKKRSLSRALNLSLFVSACSMRSSFLLWTGAMFDDTCRHVIGRVRLLFVFKYYLIASIFIVELMCACRAIAAESVTRFMCLNWNRWTQLASHYLYR